MALGYCKGCGKLVTIVARGTVTPESRIQKWFPVEHEDEEGKPCVAGMKRPL